MQQTTKKLSFLQRITLLLTLCCITSPVFAFSSNFMESIYYLTTITQDFCIAAGIGMFLAALQRFKKFGEARTMMSHQMTMTRPLLMMIAAVCLMCIPTATKTLLLAFWGSSNPMAYPVASDTAWQQAANAVVALIHFVGLLGIIRAILLFSRLGGESAQPGALGKAVLHLLGGLMCLYIMNVWSLLVYMLDFTGY